jgi:hypothetical protein
MPQQMALLDEIRRRLAANAGLILPPEGAPKPG